VIGERDWAFALEHEAFIDRLAGSVREPRSISPKKRGDFVGGVLIHAAEHLQPRSETYAIDGTKLPLYGLPSPPATRDILGAELLALDIFCAALASRKLGGNAGAVAATQLGADYRSRLVRTVRGLPRPEWLDQRMRAYSEAVTLGIPMFVGLGIQYGSITSAIVGVDVESSLGGTIASYGVFAAAQATRSWSLTLAQYIINV
jgi:hypothetical protein